MALYEALRKDETFSDETLQYKNSGNGPLFMRLLSLLLLTKPENNDPDNIEEYLKVQPKYDCLFPFSHHGQLFFSHPLGGRKNGKIDYFIAHNELALPTGVDEETQIQELKNYNDMSPEERVMFKTGVYWPDSVPTESEQIDDDYLLNLYNKKINAENFIDSINIEHNIQKSLARRLELEPRTVLNELFPVTVASTSFCLLTKIEITKYGNMGGTKVENWGAYNDTLKTIKAFKDLKQHFLTSDELPWDALKLKDLYRLECIREPSALLTNAMFLELVDNYKYFLVNYEWSKIKEQMPMAQIGAVLKSRTAWKCFMDHLKKRSLPIYYRYDYPNIDKANWSKNAVDDLIAPENNLLFHWLMNSFNNSNDFKLNTLSDIIINPFDRKKKQIEKLENEAGFYKEAGTNNYKKDFYVNTKLVTIKIMNNPNDDSFKSGDIVISEFPIRLLTELLNNWYKIDVLADIPEDNHQININLRLQ